MISTGAAITGAAGITSDDHDALRVETLVPWKASLLARFAVLLLLVLLIAIRIWGIRVIVLPVVYVRTRSRRSSGCGRGMARPSSLRRRCKLRSLLTHIR